MIKPLIKNQNQSGTNNEYILNALQERIDLFDSALKAKTFAQPIASVNSQQNSKQNNQVKVNSSNHASVTNQVHKHAQANGTPVKVLPGNASLKTQNPAEGLSDMKHFNRVRYFMNEEKGYWGCSIVAIFKSIRFYFVMLWDRTITVKALKEFCVKVKNKVEDDFKDKLTRLSNSADTLQDDPKHSGPQSNLDVLKGISEKLLEKMAKAANSLLKKNDKDDDSPVIIVGELFAFINPEGSKVVDTNSGDIHNVPSQAKTQATLPENVAVNHDKPYSDALALVDMDGCMAMASDEGVKTFLETLKCQVREEGSISIGSFSRRSILDEIVRSLRLPKPGSLFKEWQLFGVAPGDCEKEIGYRTLDSEKPSPPHMQIPRLDAIVGQCNKLSASNNKHEPFSVSDFVVHDLFQGDHDQKKSQLRQVVKSDTVYSGAVANTLRSWMTPSGGKNQKGGVLAEIQDFFSKDMKYGDITFEDLCAAFETKKMSYAQQTFFTYLWCYEKIISNDSGKVSNLFTLTSGQIGEGAERKSLKDLSADELDLVKNAVSSLSLSELKALSIVWGPCAHNISLDEEAEVTTLSDNACSAAEKIEMSLIRVWLCENIKSIRSYVPLWKFIHASSNLKTQFDTWSPNDENSNPLNVKSMQNDDALKAWFALMKMALIEILGAIPFQKSSSNLVHNSLKPVELAGPSSNCDKVLQLLASMWEDYRTLDGNACQPRKFVCCVDDGYYILANTYLVMKNMLWGVPPHIKAIRFCNEKELNVGEIETLIDGYIKFPKEIDCTQSDKEVRQKIADHYMSDQGLGVPGLVQDLMGVIASKGKAGWDPKVKETSTSKQRMYVLCKQDNKEKILNHDASDTIYAPSGIKVFTDAAKKKIVESNGLEVNSEIEQNTFSYT